MVYLLKMVIFYGYVSHNQMVMLYDRIHRNDLWSQTVFDLYRALWKAILKNYDLWILQCGAPKIAKLVYNSNK